MTVSIVTVVGNPKPGSRTRSAATALADNLLEVLPPARHQVVDLADVVAGMLAPWALSPEAAAVVSAVREADVLILATPTYKGSFAGVLKLLLDTLPAGSLARCLVLPVTTSAGPAHRHLADWQLRPVLGELGAVTPVPSLLLSEAELGDLPDLVRSYVAAHGKLILATVGALARTG